jgi:hypothetical protein
VGDLDQGRVRRHLAAVHHGQPAANSARRSVPVSTAAMEGVCRDPVERRHRRWERSRLRRPLRRAGRPGHRRARRGVVLHRAGPAAVASPRRRLRHRPGRDPAGRARARRDRRRPRRVDARGGARTGAGAALAAARPRRPRPARRRRGAVGPRRDGRQHRAAGRRGHRAACRRAPRRPRGAGWAAGRRLRAGPRAPAARRCGRRHHGVRRVVRGRGLEPLRRLATWDGHPWTPDAGYAVSVHQRPEDVTSAG